MSDIDDLFAGRAPDLAQCFLVDGERVRLTARGEAFLRPRFARVGIDVSSITTTVALREALERSFPAEWEAIAQWLEANREGSLANRQLAAIARGDYVEAERLWKLEKKATETGMREVRADEGKARE